MALHWSSSYKSRVTTRHASLAVLAIKLAMLLITAAGAAADTDILQCTDLIFMLTTRYMSSVQVLHTTLFPFAAT